MCSSDLANPNPPPLTRIFIQRDYRHGTEVRFLADYPPELIGRVRVYAMIALKRKVHSNHLTSRSIIQIEQRDFETTINYINSIFDEAEEFNFSAFCESCLGYLTANILYLLKDTRYEKVRRCSLVEYATLSVVN